MNIGNRIKIPGISCVPMSDAPTYRRPGNRYRENAYPPRQAIQSAMAVVTLAMMRLFMKYSIRSTRDHMSM